VILIDRSAAARATLGMMLCCLLLAACTGKASGRPAASPTSTGSSTVSGAAIAAVQSDLQAALAATSWPALIAEAAKDNRGCAWDAVPPVSQCTWGNPAAAHTLYLVGDSTSAAYLPALAVFMNQLPDWKMVVRSDSGCPFSTQPAPEGNGLDPNAGSASCTAHDEQVVAEIQAGHPDLVIFTSVSGASGRIPGKQAELERIAPDVGRIVVLPTTPPLKNPRQCHTPGSTPSACVTALPAAYGTWLDNFRSVAAAVHGTFLDPTELFCYHDECPAFVRTIPKTEDGVHTTVNYAEYLAPAILTLFREQGLLT
jgi:hypothetical protein